ncbi:MAG: lspA [Acidimicrobiia bacterium]|nr:lspA [Acidimicrobiia bacterium]
MGHRAGGGKGWGNRPPVIRHAFRASSIGLSGLVAAVVILLDQLTKHWALNNLRDGPTHVVWTLQFNLSFNSGMAFSKGQGFGPVISVLAVVVITVLLVSLGRSGSRFHAFCVGLVIGGALGNVADRLFRAGGNGFLKGRVIDFIDLKWWPIFNVADMAVSVGGVLLVLGSLRSSEPVPVQEAA